MNLNGCKAITPIYLKMLAQWDDLGHDSSTTVNYTIHQWRGLE